MKFWSALSTLGFRGVVVCSISILGVSSGYAGTSNVKGKSPQAKKVATKEGKPPSNTYVKSEISQARYVHPEKALLEKLDNLESQLNQRIVGQPKVVSRLVQKLRLYLESFGSRTAEPVAHNLMGLGGLGKSSLYLALQHFGFDVQVIDAQEFADEKITSEIFQQGGVAPSVGRLATIMRNWLRKNNRTLRPLILVVEELDKIPELVGDQEISRPLIGAINQITTNGKLAGAGNTIIDFSNVFIFSTMNLDPKTFEIYLKSQNQKLTTSSKATGTEAEEGPPKNNYYDFGVTDFAKFNEWMRKDPNAVYQTLALLFRTNTVSRIAPNTDILEPFTKEGYRALIRKNINDVLRRLGHGERSAKHVTVTFNDDLVDFLYPHSVYAPSGARHTVFKIDELLAPVFSDLAFRTVENDKSLNVPRLVKITLPKESHEEIKVSVYKNVLHKKQWKESLAFDYTLKFDSKTGKLASSISFVKPEAIGKEASILSPPPKRITGAMIYESRFSSKKIPRGFSKIMRPLIVGQQPYLKFMEFEMQNFLRGVRQPLAPAYQVIASFPGYGKSVISDALADWAGLPKVSINMQEFQSVDSKTAYNFKSQLYQEFSRLDIHENDPFVLVLEDLDKVNEVNPFTGASIERPVMGVIKDMLSSGKIASGDWIPEKSLANAFILIHMNFGADLFGLSSDKYLTTIDDTIEAWAETTGSVENQKKILSKLWLPETISRFLPAFTVLKPLEEEHFREIIERIPENALTMFASQPNRKNVALSFKLTAQYKNLLYGEYMIPAQGPRYLVLSAYKQIFGDLNRFLSEAGRNKKYASRPLSIVFDYDPKSNEVEVRGKVTQIKKNSPKIPDFKIRFSFGVKNGDSLQKGLRGQLAVAAHEFGHAFLGVRLGMRLKTVSALSPSSDTGGFVAYASDTGTLPTFRPLLADLYASLASRALERIIFSKAPLEKSSVFDLSLGSSADVAAATKIIWGAIQRLGIDPDGGTIERQIEQLSRNNKGKIFGTVPNHIPEGMSFVLRDMEDLMTRDFLAAHPTEWYVEKVRGLQKAGRLNEAEFYQLIGYKAPGPAPIFLGGYSQLHMHFPEVEKGFEADSLEVMRTKQSNTHTTPYENMENYLAKFATFLEKRLHGKSDSGCIGSTSLDEVEKTGQPSWD